MKQKVINILSQRFECHPIDAGFTCDVFLQNGKEELSRFYWPEIICRKDYVVMAGALGILISDYIIGETERMAISAVSSAVYVPNIVTFNDIRFIDNSKLESGIDLFATHLLELMDNLPKTIVDALKMCDNCDSTNWMSQLFYGYDIQKKEFIRTLRTLYASS